MITYQTVFKKSQVANSLVGMSIEEFDQLYEELERVYIGRESTLPYTRRNKLKRKRRMGAGRKHKYVLRDRLVMALFWLRAYTTYEVLGALYHVDKTTVEDYLKGVLDILTTMTSFHVETPSVEIPKLRSVQEVMEAFPDICFIIDTTE
jgi:DDE superfamily endonuclease